MTYKEAYEKCETLEELREEVINDVKNAMFIGCIDRIEVIEKVANEVVKAKGWTDEMVAKG